MVMGIIHVIRMDVEIRLWIRKGIEMRMNKKTRMMTMTMFF